MNNSEGGVRVTQCVSAAFVQYQYKASPIAVRLISIRLSNPSYKVIYFLLIFHALKELIQGNDLRQDDDCWVFCIITLTV